MINVPKNGLPSLIKKKFPDLTVQADFPFAKHTTIGCGGHAAVALAPSTAQQTAELLRFLSAENIPYCFLGAGANVLPADGFFHGAVIRFCSLNTLERENDTLTVGAGVTGGRLLRFARENALSGLEPFTGIPMTVGGGIAMNAGIAARHFSDVAEEVTAVYNGEIVTLKNSECGFSEKASVFQSGIAVLQARIRLCPSDKETIVRESGIYRARRAHLPKGRSMGCTFVNPPEGAAGALIDECGLKGYAAGKAFVSPVHANFIINEGTCAADVASIIDTVKRTVYEKTGILLREEIKRLPFPHT